MTQNYVEILIMYKYLKIIGFIICLLSTNLLSSLSLAYGYNRSMIEKYNNEISASLSRNTENRNQLKHDFLSEEKENSSNQVKKWSLILASYWLDFRLGHDIVRDVTLSHSDFDSSRISSQARIASSILAHIEGNETLSEIIDQLDELYYDKFFDLIYKELEHMDFADSNDIDSSELIFRNVEARVMEALSKTPQSELRILLRFIYEEVKKNKDSIPDFPIIEDLVPYLYQDLGYRDLLLITIDF